MKSLTVFLLLITCASACGDNAYRCVNPEGSVADDGAKTRSCCTKLAQTDCYCAHRAEDYCDPDKDNIDNFKECCESFEGFGWREC